MSLLTGDEIKKLNIISPFKKESRFNGKVPILSIGCGICGYDISLSSKIFQEIQQPQREPLVNNAINCKNPESFAFEDLKLMSDKFGEYFIMSPNSTALGLSVETFNMPDDVMGLCYAKSTYARCGVGVNVTPLEPGWKGQLVIEVINHTSSFNRVYANEGIAQIVFFKSDRKPSRTYASKDGKYQNQSGMTYSKV